MEIKPIRHVKFRNTVYLLQNGMRMDIIPIPYWDENSYNNLLTMGIEKYLIDVVGGLKMENFRESTLENFDRVMSHYVEAFRRLK